MDDPAAATMPDLLDRIYTAAIEPDAWSSVIAGLQPMFRSRAVGLYSADFERRDVGLIHLQDLDLGWVDEYVRDWLCHNPWSDVTALQQPGAIRTEHSLDEWYRQPGYYRSTSFYNEWMRPQQHYHSLGTNLVHDRSFSTKLILYRDAKGGAYTPAEIRRFRTLIPHITRAVETTRRLALRESRMGDAFGVIDSLRFGVLFLDDTLRVMEANHCAAEMFRCGAGLVAQDGRLHAVHRADRRKFDAMLNAALAVHLGLSAAAPGDVKLRRGSHRAALRASVTPLPRHPGDPWVLRHAAMVLMISDPELESTLPDHWLQQRYGLTGSESRLVQSLLEGGKLREVAERNGLTYETARWYLKVVFQKTGTSRQSELISTLLQDRAAVRLDH